MLKNIWAPKEVQEQRMNVCKSCTEFDGVRCLKCGCFMFGKIRFNNVKCPLNKWAK